MRLAIFDIDGTLTQTNRLDAMCFVRAVAEEFGIATGDDWSQYAHSTDSGISSEIVERALHRRPTAVELSRLQHRFVALLEHAIAASPASCRATPGAAEGLRQLDQAEHWAVAIATGSWRASAVVKMRAAGLSVAGRPAAFADDSVWREDIIACAQRRALAHYECAQFDRVVYLGDAVWDVRSARRLRLPFIGVGGARRAAMLRGAGARYVLTDFAEWSRVLRYLDEATIPEGESR